ncbi:MAG TPA: Hsp70 family protein, partial [Kofleriaceae bacterium]|nr:Hsp70 family protein [Kofleriaceae bacterium]
MQWHGLVHACRLAKETILGDDTVASVPITIAGRGSRLIGGTLKTEIARAELEETILGGFFPLVERDAQPQRQRSGLQEFGLPYAADPAVPRHLAAFLARHPVERIDAVLFNGGAMTPASLRRRILDQIAAWPDGPPRELANQRPELAVAQGAAYYGLVRRGLATRIKGGTARSFYVGAEGTGAQR